MSVHVSVLPREVKEHLLPAIKKGSWAVDCTLGAGGHTRDLLGLGAQVLAIDQDSKAIARAEVEFAQETREGRLLLREGRFSEIQKITEGFEVCAILADLGFSSDQLEDPTRGLSFQTDGPLDMRLSMKTDQTARDLLMSLSEQEIADLIFELGDERLSRRIAKRIIDARLKSEIPNSTKWLEDLVFHAYPPPQRFGRIHPATRTFQALRIAVNDELGELDRLLEHGIIKLGEGGRIAIISFHSLEDRRVKQAFNRSERLKVLSKKPIEADEIEQNRNPRSRSAKLRIAEKKVSEKKVSE